MVEDSYESVFRQAFEHDPTDLRRVIRHLRQVSSDRRRVTYRQSFRRSLILPGRRNCPFASRLWHILPIDRNQILVQIPVPANDREMNWTFRSAFNEELKKLARNQGALSAMSKHSSKQTALSVARKFIVLQTVGYEELIQEFKFRL